MPTLEELRTKMAEAVRAFNESGQVDMSQIQAVSKEMDKAKGEIAKAEADKLLKESEALAGKREALATKIHGAVKAMGLDGEIVAVKGWGFTYKVDKANPNEPDVVYRGVSLATAVVKAKKTGGGGTTGKSKDEYGLSLSEIVDKFATNAEKAAISAEGISNSRSWQLKVAVKKAAIAAGKLAPVK